MGCTSGKIVVKTVYVGAKFPPYSCAGQSYCVRSDDDCVFEYKMNDDSAVDLRKFCNGEASCSQNAPYVISLAHCIASYETVTSFAWLEYYCIEDSIVSMCADQSISGQRVFISNHGYGLADTDTSQQCACSVQTYQSNSGIQIHTMHRDLVANSDDSCDQSISVHLQDESTVETWTCTDNPSTIESTSHTATNFLYVVRNFVNKGTSRFLLGFEGAVNIGEDLRVSDAACYEPQIDSPYTQLTFSCEDGEIAINAIYAGTKESCGQFDESTASFCCQRNNETDCIVEIDFPEIYGYCQALEASATVQVQCQVVFPPQESTTPTAPATSTTTEVTTSTTEQSTTSSTEPETSSTIDSTSITSIESTSTSQISTTSIQLSTTSSMSTTTTPYTPFSGAVNIGEDLRVSNAACYEPQIDSPYTQLTFSCEDGEIAINAIYAGTKESCGQFDESTASSCCQRNTETDCIVEIDFPDIYGLCQGRQSCNIAAPNHVDRTCGLSTYVFIEHYCIQIASCKAPISLHGRYVDGKGQHMTTYDVGHAAVLMCDDGYDVGQNVVTTEIVCSENHTWSGQLFNCSIKVTPRSSSTGKVVGSAVGGAVGGLVAVLMVIILIMFLIRRRNPSPKQRYEHTSQSPNSMTANDDQKSIRLSTFPPTNMPEAPSRANKEEEADAYYCFTSPLKLPTKGIKLEDLADFVLNTCATSDKYIKEFQGLSDGMTQTHKAALKNKGKNRYKNIYAYDVSRVVLEVWNPPVETDYINACYIHGYNTPKMYVASQGATKKNINDIWRMIWQLNCGKIVMLTNIREEGKVKCEQYWPDEGTKVYGSISVTAHTSEVFSNFVIRSFTVCKDNKDGRRILQFHFTAWPDREVPKFCFSLVHFRNKVKTTHSQCKGPLVVHCSAGIGQTGTYIAIDYLTDQGLALGFVDVPGCVETLRRQRVNMVQTKEQYIFVHQALVETLMLSTSALSTSEAPHVYERLQNIDPSYADVYEEII